MSSSNDVDELQKSLRPLARAFVTDGNTTVSDAEADFAIGLHIKSLESWADRRTAPALAQAKIEAAREEIDAYTNWLTDNGTDTYLEYQYKRHRELDEQRSKEGGTGNPV